MLTKYDNLTIVIEPTDEEIAILISQDGLDSGFVYSSLDEEESPRVEFEDTQTLIIIDVPVMETRKTQGEKPTLLYYTTPIGIIRTKTDTYILSSKENLLVEELTSGNLNYSYKSRLVLTLLMKTAQHYLRYLKTIDKLTVFTEKSLGKTLTNTELIRLLELEKSLVYFQASLKSNQTVLDRIYNGRVMPLYEEDKDLLEDVLIEFRQAVDMASIYAQTLEDTMQATSSIINNNLNIVMRKLTIITIILAIPTIVFSFYGMNVEKLPHIESPLFACILSLCIAIVVAFYIKK
jgi:magnesium transporter